MGMGATDTFGRLSASLGQLGACSPTFQSCQDVSNGGVLLALPSLLANGLLDHPPDHFQLSNGYYRSDSIFLLLAFMSLSRIKSIEALRYSSPGELGKILGLDRIPEAKILREKVHKLATGDQPSQWAEYLSQNWMTESPGVSGLFYIDGHVRVYNGHQTQLPKHYVARQKLCLRATTDYWINAMDGQPLFLINKAVDPGLLKVMEDEIIPKLESDLSFSTTETSSPKFTLVFDREGYSPGFFHRMKDKNIACLTYNKFPKKPWCEDEFSLQQVKLASGLVVEMKLAERGSFIGQKLWLREIRKLTDSGHQTSVLSTNYEAESDQLAASMFARWSQENYFKYMREHFNIDRLVDYTLDTIPDTTRIVNPEYRSLDSQLRKKRGLLNRTQAKFGTIVMKEVIEPLQVEKYLHQKAELLEVIENIEKEILGLKQEKKKIPSHISIVELPDDQRYKQLGKSRKYLIDIIKMIAYRAETSMVNIIRERMNDGSKARALVRSIFKNEVDLSPDADKGILNIKIHHLANRKSSEIISFLCNDLNATNTVFPGTNLRLCFKLVSEKFP